jgi:hypothetical protein
MERMRDRKTPKGRAKDGGGWRRRWWCWKEAFKDVDKTRGWIRRQMMMMAVLSLVSLLALPGWLGQSSYLTYRAAYTYWVGQAAPG